MTFVRFEKTTPAQREAETQKYLDKLWRENVRRVWGLAILAGAIFLVSLGYFYLGLKTPTATLYRPIAYGLCGFSFFLAVGTYLGYLCDKKSHAEKSKGMLKLSRQ